MIDRYKNHQINTDLRTLYAKYTPQFMIAFSRHFIDDTLPRLDKSNRFPSYFTLFS